MGQDFKKRAEALVAQMTLEEKASQLRYDAPAIPRLGIPAYNWWNEAAHGVARAGTATVFPQNIGISATFDAPLAHRIGESTPPKSPSRKLSAPITLCGDEIPCARSIQSSPPRAAAASAEATAPPIIQ